MKETGNALERYGTTVGDAAATSLPSIPQLRVNVFGGFEMMLDGRPVEYVGVRRRRLKLLLGILVLHHGQELYSDYIADSIWPDSPAEKQRNCFYNLWYMLMNTAVPEGVDKSAYFSREQFSCRLLDTNVSTDVADAERACEDLANPGLDPVGAIDAYQRLQRSYRGDLLPGEDRNGIIIRAREEWRERVAEALYLAAKTMCRQGDARTALWLVKAACRVDEMREDLVRLRMRLLIDLGRPSAALRVYNEMKDYLMDEVGLNPSAQSAEIVQEVVEAGPVSFQAPVPGSRRRRRGAAPKKAPRKTYSFPQQVDLPL